MGINPMVILLTSAILIKHSLSQCPRKVGPRTAVESILQDILSSSNTQGAMEILKMAAAGTNGNLPIPERPIPVRPFVPKAADMSMPIRTVLPNELMMPRNMPSNDMVKPNVMPLEMRAVFRGNDVAMPGAVITNAVQQDLFVPRYAGPLKQPNLECGQALYPGLSTASYAPLAPAEELMYSSRSSMMPMGNPFLPAASPISAFAPPTSNMLPLPTQARSQYLRKIPIPPPTL